MPPEWISFGLSLFVKSSSLGDEYHRVEIFGLTPVELLNIKKIFSNYFNLLEIISGIDSNQSTMLYHHV